MTRKWREVTDSATAYAVPLAARARRVMTWADAEEEGGKEIGKEVGVVQEGEEEVAVRMCCEIETRTSSGRVERVSLLCGARGCGGRRAGAHRTCVPRARCESSGGAAAGSGVWFEVEVGCLCVAWGCFMAGHGVVGSGLGFCVVYVYAGCGERARG